MKLIELYMKLEVIRRFDSSTSVIVKTICVFVNFKRFPRKGDNLYKYGLLSVVWNITERLIFRTSFLRTIAMCILLVKRQLLFI